VSSAPPKADDPYISHEERAQILRWLDESHREFLATIDGVSDAQWTWKPAPERWSVGEAAEHIVLGEALLFDIVRKSLSAPPNPAWQEQTNGKTELLVRVLPSEGKAVSPEPLVPRQGLTRAHVNERFARQRVDVVTFTRETQAALKAHTTAHPMRFFGTLNAHQWLIYVPLHTIRHSRQIADVKAAAAYPYEYL
jgi:hypothetical protein